MSTNFEISEEEIENIDEKYFDDLEQGMSEKNGIHVNPVLLRALDFNHAQAIMLSQYAYCASGRNGKPFLYQDKNFMYSIGSPDKIMRTKKALKEKGLISVILKGLPAKSYIVYNKDAVDNLKKQYIVDTYFSIPEYLRPDYDENSRNKFMKKSINWTMKESINYYNKDNNKDNIKENTKRSLETEKNIPASGSPSSPKVDELRLAEEIFENRFWVLVQNKVGKEQAKQRFFQITNNCKNEKKVNEVIEGYKRYLSFLAKNKANNFNRRAKDPATFLNVKNKLWLEPWEFVEEEVTVSAVGSRIKQPKNWQDRIGVAKSLGLLDDFEQEEIREMYKAWKFIPHEAKQAIASEAVDNRLKQIDEYRKTEKERQQKEEEERKKQKNARLARDYEDEYQSLKAVLNFDYENLEDALNHGEKALYEVVNKILEYEQQQEEKEAEIKRQQELEQKKIDAEKSKIALDEAERELWTYISTKIDAQKFIEENKAIFPTTYEKLKALFANGETLLDVVFGENATEIYVHRLSMKILYSLFDKDENVKTLYNKSSEAWTKWNQLQKEII